MVFGARKRKGSQSPLFQMHRYSRRKSSKAPSPQFLPILILCESALSALLVQVLLSVFHESHHVLVIRAERRSLILGGLGVVEDCWRNREDSTTVSTYEFHAGEFVDRSAVELEVSPTSAFRADAEVWWTQV